MHVKEMKILIVGGGFSGLSAAIQLRKLGAQVDLVEKERKWHVQGAGLTLGAATLRTFVELGVLDEFLKHGFAAEGAEYFTASGEKVGEQDPQPRLARPDVPPVGAILRPVFAGILANKAIEAGTNIRLGVTFTEIVNLPVGVKVMCSDGTANKYDLVIGADGIYSDVRKTVFPAAPQPKYAGQGVWRALVPRPPEVKNVKLFMGDKIKFGVNPVSQDQMYMLFNDPRPTNDYIDPAEFSKRLKELCSLFSAPFVREVRDSLDENSNIVFRPMENLLVPLPWFKGHVVLIGDAVHATTPHMGAGACIGIEDAIVLAQELDRQSDLETALDAYGNRRWDRCRMVVENSQRMGVIELSNGDPKEHAALWKESASKLAEPI